MCNKLKDFQEQHVYLRLLDLIFEKVEEEIGAVN